jgi:hypothetical protein
VSWATSGLRPTSSGALERGDEVQGVPDRGQEEVAARLVGLRLEREAEPVLLCLGVLHQRVDGLPVAVERVPGILGHTGLGALAAAPADEHLGPQLRAQVDGAHRLADRRAPHSAVVGGERPVLERRMPEEIRRSHTDAHVRFLERGLEAGHDTVALRGGDAPGDEILVVEAHAPCAELAEPPHGIGGVERRARRGAEGVAARIADGPQPEGEPVPAAGRLSVLGRRVYVDDRHNSLLFRGYVRPAKRASALRRPGRCFVQQSASAPMRSASALQRVACAREMPLVVFAFSSALNGSIWSQASRLTAGSGES